MNNLIYIITRCTSILKIIQCVIVIFIGVQMVGSVNTLTELPLNKLSEILKPLTINRTEIC